MNSLPLPVSLNRRRVVSLSEPTAWGQVGKNAASPLGPQLDIQGLTRSAKNHHVGRGHHPKALGVAA
jgi:hypothetical protein